MLGALCQKARAKLMALGAELGSRFDYFGEMRMVNTFDAHRLLAWAGTLGRDHALRTALFSTSFSECQDVSDPAVLVDIAEGVGLDRAEAAAVLVDGRYGDDVRAVERIWAQNGVQGVPAMVFQRHHLVTGAQGVDNYAAILWHLAGRDAA